jgi:hypothetical protein
MRFLPLAVSALLALSVVLAACSSSSGGPQIVPASEASLKVTTNARSCPSQYLECITLSQRRPFEQQWCVVSNGHDGYMYAFNASQCGSPAQGYWYWSAKTYTVSPLRRFWGFKVSLSPASGSGGETDLTITENHKFKPSGGRINYEAKVVACIVTQYGTDCLGRQFIGILTK